jgi:hypothetical protein
MKRERKKVTDGHSNFASARNTKRDAAKKFREG